MAASLALATALDFDDDAEEFFGMLLPALISLSAHKNSRKRRRSTNSKKKDGRIGRKWSQRKKGEMKPTDFSWWKLINKADVADVTSRNGKVMHVCLCLCSC